VFYHVDAAFLLYNALEAGAGRQEIYVQRLPSHTNKFKISNSGGYSALWSRDGRLIFYISLDRKLMAVDVQAGERFETGSPRVLLENARSVLPNGLSVFAVSADGKRFLIPSPVEEASNMPLTILLNWPATLKKT
jgi:hypothetical protein